MKKAELEKAHGFKDLAKSFKNCMNLLLSFLYESTFIFIKFKNCTDLETFFTAVDSTKAVVMLPSLLYQKVMKKEQAAAINDGAQKWLRHMPCSALLQIAPVSIVVYNFLMGHCN